MVETQVPAPPQAPAKGVLQEVGARRALGGFFVSGLLLSFLGAILPAWGHHIHSDYAAIGWYFFSLIAGMLLSVWAAPPLIVRRGIGWVMAVGCALACGCFLYLAAVSPPIAYWWRFIGLAGIGFASGLLHTAIFHTISPIYHHDPAATVNLAGILFGSGCALMAFLISGTFYVYTAPSIQILIAVIPGMFAIRYARKGFPPQPIPPHPSFRDMLAELRSPVAVLLSLLLFFQFGNEWAVAGWLPLFLIQRLGISPASSLVILGVYWLALLIGRVAAQAVLPHVSHARILVASVVAAMLGCLILTSTNNRFGAVTGVLFVGAGFAPIYPLVVERIGHRFPYFHPGFYNGIFSLAFVGGMLAPCTLGYFASLWGVGVVMGLPLLGTVMVFTLLLLIWLDVRLSAWTEDQRSRKTAAGVGPS